MREDLPNPYPLDYYLRDARRWGFVVRVDPETGRLIEMLSGVDYAKLVAEGREVAGVAVH